MRALLFVLLAGSFAYSQTPRAVPKLEPVAETKLIMEGLVHPNFKGLEKHLRQKPNDDQAWVFARGQAILLAETGNLMMLRPPKSAQAQQVWFDMATEFRTQSRALAALIATKDYDRSKSGLTALSTHCNRCHQTFKIPVEISPWDDPPAPGPKAE